MALRSSSMDMCEGPLLKKIIIYTIPIILTGILQLLFNAADMVVVGRFCGSVSLGAIGATGALINLIINLFMGLSVGAGVLAAQALGAEDGKGVFHTVHTSIPVALISGAFLMVIGVVGSKWFLELMDTPENVLKLSTVYMRIYFCGMIPSMVYNFGAAILRAAGDTKGPLFFLTIAGVVNVILNLFFVVVLHMNVAGVALATVISQILSAVLILMALTRRGDLCRLELKEMHIYGPVLRKMLRIGLPAGLQGSLFSISNVLIQSSVNSFGEVAMSGNAAAGNIEGFVYIIMNSFHQTTLNFVGQNVGAKNYKRVGRVVRISLFLVFAAGLTAGLCAWSFGRTLLGIYITDSADAIAYGLIRMSYICTTYFLCGMMDTMTGAMRGLGVSIEPLVITVLGVCVLRIAWIYTVFQIPGYHTLNCLYLSYPLSWGLTLIAQILVYLRIIRRVKKSAEEEAAA